MSNANAAAVETSAIHSIALGATVEIGTVRIHRFADSFRVTDMTNAGKRGQVVREAMISRHTHDRDVAAAWMDSMAKGIVLYGSYDRVLALISDILVDAPGEIDVSERSLRGVDVVPAGNLPLVVATAWGRITAELDSFLVRRCQRVEHPRGLVMAANDDGTDHSHTTSALYYECGRTPTAAKKSAAVFYAWVRDNRAAAELLSFDELRATWRELGVHADFH